MSLCSGCGHNSVFHRDPLDGCAATVLYEIEETTNLVKAALRPCGCALTRWDPEFSEGHDERGSLLPGWPKAAQP